MALKRPDEHRFTYRLYDSDERDRRILQMQNELLDQGVYRNQNALIREGIRLAYHKAKGNSSMEKELVDIHTIAEEISDFYLEKMQEMMIAHDMKMIVAVSQGSLAGMLQAGQPLQLATMGAGVQEVVQPGTKACTPDAK